MTTSLEDRKTETEQSPGDQGALPLRRCRLCDTRISISAKRCCHCQASQHPFREGSLYWSQVVGLITLVATVAFFGIERFRASLAIADVQLLDFRSDSKAILFNSGEKDAFASHISIRPPRAAKVFRVSMPDRLRVITLESGNSPVLFHLDDRIGGGSFYVRERGLDLHNLVIDYPISAKELEALWSDTVGETCRRVIFVKNGGRTHRMVEIEAEFATRGGNLLTKPVEGKLHYFEIEYEELIPKTKSLDLVALTAVDRNCVD